MKRTEFPLCASNRQEALIRRLGLSISCAGLAFLFAFKPTTASTVPHFGGTLRVQMSERITTLDPRQWPSDAVANGAAERAGTLVFDRLVQLDAKGALEPALAISWVRDAEAKRLEFRLREGVKFSDGAPLTAPIAAMALQQLLGNSYDVSASADSVVIQADHPIPELLWQLSSGRYFIFHLAEDNSISGTGPFRVVEWPTAEGVTKAVFVANESCWAGRPFVDKIELQMGVDPLQQANAVSFGQADVVDLPASEVRRAAQRGVRTVSSDPVDLLALVVDPSRPAFQNERFRQALSLAIDRASISSVILQRQAVPAGGLLPNWISGYAHLFPPVFDLARAKELLAASAQEHSRPAPLVLVYDSGDAEARAVADRVAVNLLEAGVRMQVSGQNGNSDGAMRSPAAAIRLVRHRFVVPDAGAALNELLAALGETSATPETIEQTYEAERAFLQTFRVIPLVHVSESYGLSPDVRDWMPPRWGGWSLADVWLGPPAPGGNPR